MQQHDPIIWYQLMPDKFAYVGAGVKPRPGWHQPTTTSRQHGGTLQGIVEKVEHGFFNWITNEQVDWGIYLTPVYASHASYHKYWPDDHGQVDQALGGLAGLEQLASIVREKKGRLMVDLVFNHTSLTHIFFFDILRFGPESRYYRYYRRLPDLSEKKLIIPLFSSHDPLQQQYRITQDNTLVIQERFFFPQLGQSLLLGNDAIEGRYFKFVRQSKPANYSCWWRIPELPELNTDEAQVQDYLFHSVDRYLQLGIRCFRLDVADALPNGQRFWQMFRTFVDARTGGDESYLVGEIDKPKQFSTWLPRHLSDSASLDAVMNYPLRQAIIHYLGTTSATTQMEQGTGQAYWNGEKVRTDFRDVWGKLPVQVLRNQFNLVGSHDVTRIARLIQDPQDLKTAFALLFSWPGQPCLYYGDEYGLQGAVGVGCEGARETLRWKNMTQVQGKIEGLIIFLQRLIRLRKARPELWQGDFTWLGAHPDILAYQRAAGERQSVVIAAPKHISSMTIVQWLTTLEIDCFYLAYDGYQHLKLANLTAAESDEVRQRFGVLLASRGG